MYYIQTRSRINSKKFDKTICVLPEIKDVKHYLKDIGVSIVHKPYIFTYLGLSDGSIITQTVVIGKDKQEILVSPEKLAKELGIK